MGGVGGVCDELHCLFSTVMKRTRSTFLCILTICLSVLLTYYGVKYHGITYEKQERDRAYLKKDISESSTSAATTSKGTTTHETVTNTIFPTTTDTTTATTDVVDDNIMMEASPDVIHNLSDVVIDRGVGNTVHHIYSAYYDSRTNLAHRPAIVLFGYVSHRKKDKIYCKAIYEDNSTGCIGNMVHSSLIAPNVWPEIYFCDIKSHDKIPTHVVLSESGTCDTSKWSVPIPVWNRDKAPVRDAIGICVHGTVFTNKIITTENVFQMMLEFVTMAKVLGVDIVTIYNKNVTRDIIEKILHIFPGFVDIVQWKNLDGILHSRGQRVLLNDCLYRNMRRVRYLGFFDLDEMILPASTNNWRDMLNTLEKKGKYATYTFSNNFMEEVPPTKVSVNLSNHLCPYMQLPKYFVRMKRLPWPTSKQNTKMKMIVKPEFVSALCIHNVCQPTVRGYSRTVRVPSSVGWMAHYRVPVPSMYVYGKGVEDRTALKYRDQVMGELAQLCS